MAEPLALNFDPNKANQAHAAAYGALVILLIDKGVITRGEYDRAYIQAQHVISQEFAKKRDEAEQAVEKQYPTLTKILKTTREDIE